MNYEIILNVFIALIIYNLILSSLGKVILKYFLDHSETVQKEKKSFQDKLKEKLNEKSN